MGKGNVASKQRFADRIRGKVTFGADASTAVFDVITTGMNLGQGDPYMWSLLGFSIMPRSGLSMPLQAANSKFTAGLLLGEHSAWVYPEETQYITGVGLTHSITTSGATWSHYPLVAPLSAPVPIFSNKLTVQIGAVNDATFNSLPWVYEITFIPMAANRTDVLEYLAAFGQA